mgnify:CR=1 FL=1
MRNHELIEKIYKILEQTNEAEHFLSPVEFQIKHLIEKERPELLDGEDAAYWKGGHLKSKKEWLEEMKNHPHQDNHMD